MDLLLFNFVMKRDRSRVMQIFIVEYIIMQNCRDRMDYIGGWCSHAFHTCRYSI